MAKMLMIVDGRGGSDFAACRVCEFPDGGASRWQGSVQEVSAPSFHHSDHHLTHGHCNFCHPNPTPIS